uniref:Uncharacterized protein n=1 Tax=Lactuca sativa TaxID=4236 RepID=A0A9R1WUE7_LACSA|nr:hypothetical protein LSAT_V11C900472930 [Lactuca sativa]
MKMHRQNQIKREEETEVEIANMKEYYCSEEGWEVEKAKWRKIYYSTLKEKEKEVHEEEEEVSSEVSESKSESEPQQQFPPAMLPPKQLTPSLSPPSLGYKSRKEDEMKNL